MQRLLIMTDKGMQFMEMLHEELGEHHKVMPIMKKMVAMLEPNEEFNELMEVYPGVEAYGAFMTEKEAKRVTSAFVNYDRSTGPKWRPETLFDAVKSVGGTLEEYHKYNKWALYTVMNMIHADYGGVLQTLVQDTDYPKLVYRMAIAFITDPDRKHTIRHYFCLDY